MMTLAETVTRQAGRGHEGVGRGAAGLRVVQTIDPGVFQLLEQMFDTVGDQLLPLVKGIGRRLKGTALEADRGMTDQLDRTLKNIDIMKDLLSSLRKIDTRRLTAPS